MLIYFAGPDVFKPDYREWCAYVKQLCENHGWTPLFPDPKDDNPISIYNANIKCIDDADVVVANLSPFRGCEPDSGTVREATIGEAKGKIVVGYIERPMTTVDRVREGYGPVTEHADGWFYRDRDGNGIEDCGFPLNLMLAVPWDVVSGGVGCALTRLAERVHFEVKGGVSS